MKKLLTALLFAALAVSCSNKEAFLEVSVINPSDFSRAAELVEIPMDVISEIPLAEGQVYVVKNAQGEIVPSQVTYNDKLVFQSGAEAGATSNFTIAAGEKTDFKTKTYGRFAPERLDDFIWENDRIGMRAYGTALIEKDGPSNGFDALYKRSEDMVLDNWYSEYLNNKVSYHRDHGTGLDDYKVGRSLGAGSMAPYVDGKLILNHNFSSHEVYENGPLRTTFKLIYDSIEVGGKKYTESRTISIDAGSQFSKVTQQYGFDSPVNVVTGFTKRGANDKSYSSDKWLIYPEPATKLSSGVWMGVIVPQGIKSTLSDLVYEVPKGEKGAGVYMHTLAFTTYDSAPITYYTGFGWEKHGYPTLESFQTYVENFTKSLDQPFTIMINVVN